MRDVMVSGAGIAGLAVAYWLRRNGDRVTVVEKAPGPRPGGQAVDVRGAALDVVSRMGLGGAVRDAGTRTRGMTMLDADGAELFRSEDQAYSSGRLDGEDVELLREDLVALLAGLTRDVEVVYDDAIAALTDGPDGVRVELASGDVRTVDLVVGADGMHSAARRLAFGPEERYSRHLGQYVAVFSAPNVLGLEDWQVWVQDQASGVGGGIYPVRDNTELRVTLGFASGPLDHDHTDVARQKSVVAERLGGVGWEMPRLLEIMAGSPDFYFDAMAQIHLESWSTGRVALVGDAGYCASVLSGQGTSLALVGAYVLAQELAAHPDHRDAFAAYDRRMRPFVAANQALATENPGGPASLESMDRAKNAITLDEPAPARG
ncbi:FAD-dependent oxidoreductase [Isoptericola sp. NPDC057391]|uniref:FAD-dependent oxidoreductase n=1 Tax=Isoptericola sp. NPDC057391 TaxID=3346117 RepID=UPI00363421E1